VVQRVQQIKRLMNLSHKQDFLGGQPEKGRDATE
jgi:hypothetical protein